MDKLDFSALAGGAVQEKLQYALNEVAENISDPNTDAKKTRNWLILWFLGSLLL